MLSEKAVEAIQASTLTTTIKAGADEYLTRPVFDPPMEARAKALTVATLDGFADFVCSDFDGEFERGLAVHVESPGSVVLVSGLYGRARQREEYYRAELAFKSFRFGEWYDNESFVIALQSLFVDTEQRAQILSIAGGIQQNDVSTYEDDGITQTVKTRAGISMVKEAKVPNPVTLAPYRTFPEVAQPASLFVFRMKEGNGLPACALFEADGGAWKLEGVKAIAKYLKEKLPEAITISA